MPIYFRSLTVSLVLCVFAVAPLAAQSSTSDRVADQAAALADRAQQEMAQGNDAAARSDFAKLAALEPGVAEVHATLAALDFQSKLYSDAVEQIRMAEKLKPGLPRLGALLGLSQSALGQYRAAKPRLEACFQRQSETTLRRLCGLQLMRVDQGLEQDADAVRVALALNQAFPNDPEVLYRSGRIYGSYAFEVMQRLHDSAPNSVWMLMAQGEANESAKNYDAAITAYRHVLAVDPHRAGMHYRLGRVYLRRFLDTDKVQDQDAALAEFRAELAVDPDDGNAAYEVANLDAERGNRTQALAEYTALVERLPDFEAALVGLAGQQNASGDYAGAAVRLRQATKLNPADEVAWYRLAVALRGAHQMAAARTAMDQYLKLHAAPTQLAPSELSPQTIGGDKQTP